MCEPKWEDGFPSNIEAAAEDALCWLKFFQSRSKMFRLTAEDWDALSRCILSLADFAKNNKTQSDNLPPLPAFVPKIGWEASAVLYTTEEMQQYALLAIQQAKRVDPAV